MIDYNEVSTINVDISTRVRNFKKKGDTSWNWSCDICGDSKRDSRKARFYCSSNGQQLMCFCHNCGYSNTFRKYTEHQHPDVYRRLGELSFFEQQTLFNINDIIKTIDDDNIVGKLCYVDRFTKVGDWITFLKKKKIILNKNNFDRAYNVLKSRNISL